MIKGRAQETREKGAIEYSFKKGLAQARQMDIPILKAEIMAAIGITSEPSWSLRSNGRVEPRVSEIRAIEGVFEKYGITDIWGGDES
jgi:hypothetical protein